VFGTSTARGFGVDRSEAFTREYLAARGRHFTVLLRQSVAGFALQAIAAASLLGAGGALVLAGELTLGQLVAAELIVGSVVASLAKLGKQLEAAYDLLAAVDKIGHLVELEVERDDGASVRPEGPLGLGVDNLEIEVGTAPHQRPLRIGSFTIERGAEVAILGASGSGKSTLMDALRGARPASAGRIAIDGDDVRTLSLAALRARVAVAREGEIFEGTIAENLRIGRTGVPTRALVEALRAVELEDIVLDHREGLGRVLVPGSGAMSTGEVRRLMIARALVGAPGLIVIDGCLDALPTDLASRIIDRLRRLDATLIVLTTRADLAALLPRRLRLDGNGDGVVGDAPPGAAAAGRPEERR
jgi:ABC-type bacteriocin/lantibiotic exporter with double-glycine peptidase domain